MNRVFYLYQATEIIRNEQGVARQWKQGELLEKFRSPSDLASYIDQHTAELTDAVILTGSASVTVSANAYLAEKLSERKFEHA